MQKNRKDRLVSIVTPIYNGEVFVAETIETVLAQTYENWEWIIVDDGSRDRTREIIRDAAKKDKRIRLVKLAGNGGAAKARNAGIMAMKGKYLCFLDADDLWAPEKIAKQVKFMSEEGCAFSFTGYEFADAFGKPNGKVVRVPAEISYKQALKNTTIWTSTVMLDMEKLAKEDVLMPDVASEDTATWWKLLKMVNYAYGLNEVLSYYRRSGQTLSSNKLVAIKRIWALYRNYEKLNLAQSFVNFVGYATNAVRRRV